MRHWVPEILAIVVLLPLMAGQALTEQAETSGEAPGQAPPACPALGYEDCLKQRGCEFASGGHADAFGLFGGKGQCRLAPDSCGRSWSAIAGREACEAEPACTYIAAGPCYCPPSSVIACVCGGGPPPRCVLRDT